jgi:hypothetical protein
MFITIFWFCMALVMEINAHFLKADPVIRWLWRIWYVICYIVTITFMSIS